VTESATPSLVGELRGQRQPRPPFWFMRQAGRYLPEYQQLRREEPDFLKFCYRPDLTVEAALQPLRRFAMDAAILFSDILVVPDGLGCEVRFVDGVGPLLEPVCAARGIPAFDVERFDERLAPVYASLAALKPRLPAGVELIGFAGAPWTLAVYMVEGRGGSDCERIRRQAWRDADGFGRLIDRLIEATTHHLDRQIRHGADVVQLFDSWAGRLSEREFHQWVIKPTKRIVEGVKSRWPDVPVIGFPRGAGVLYGAYLAETGVDAVSVDSAVPLAWAATALQMGGTVQGNLDNLLLLEGGDALDTEVERILDTLSDGGFVFNLGHGILPQTPPEHVARVAGRVRAAVRR
jgi:uroporphyrinogen decarboxylase